MVYLCLLAFFINLLHLFEIEVFSLLKHNYKMLLAQKIQFTTLNIDKTDFIILIQNLQQKVIIAQNTQLVMQAT